MKKSIIMTIIVAMVLSLVSFASVVNAADNTANVSISVNPTTAKKGDTVTATIHSDKALATAVVVVKYDKDLLEYVSASPILAANTDEAGVAVINFNSTTNVNNLTVTFKVIGTKGSAKISAEPKKFAAGTDKASIYTVDAIKGAPTVTIKEKEETPTPTTPTKPSTNSTPTKPATNSSSSTNSTSKAPTKYPSTGYSVVALGASVVAIIALGAISVKVFKK